MTVVRFSDIRFSYDNGPMIFDGLELSLGSGVICAIMGKSGCGKSTLLNLLNGTLNSHSGSIKIRDKVCATIFQEKLLVPWKTISENIAFGAKSLRMKVSDSDIEKCMLEAGLSPDIGSAYPKILSGGMKQRVSFARAMLCKPEILFMDEPFAALDTSSKEDLMTRVVNFVAQSGSYAVLVTHDIYEACKISHVIYEMRGLPATLTKLLDMKRNEREKMSVRATIKNIRDKLRSNNRCNFSKYAICNPVDNIGDFIDMMRDKNWRVEYIEAEAKPGFRQRPDLIVIDANHPGLPELIDKYKDEVTRILCLGEAFGSGLPDVQSSPPAILSGTTGSLVKWWGWNEIYGDLIKSVSAIRVDNVTIGHNWCYTQAGRGGGLARVPSRGTEGARTIDGAGDLRGKTLKQLARRALSDDDLERSIGISAINAFHNATAEGYKEEERWGFRPFRELSGEKVCIGNFPPAKKILPDVKIIELEPRQGHYAVEDGEYLIPHADHIIITAQTLVNGTLPRILFLAQGANIMLLGPTAPLSSVWKKYGVRWVCGVVTTDQQKMLDFVSQAGSMLLLEQQAQKMTLEY